MPINLLLAPVGAGKTEAALERLLQTLSRQPFARIWVLLSGERQTVAFRQRLMDSGSRVFFNVELFNFYTLYARLLDNAGQPPRRLDDTARFGLLRAILTRLQRARQLPLYDPIAQTPGFVRIVSELLYELKSSLVYPNDFERAAKTAKDRELGRIYSAYQDALREHNLVDREGEGWLALDCVRDSSQVGRDIDLLLVDGYDQFTPLQATLLKLLASRVRDNLVTLTTVPDREKTIGKRFARALKTLREVEPEIQIFSPDRPADDRQPDLRTLAENIFRRGAALKPGSDSVKLIEAPDPAQEVAAVLRRVKRLLLGGARPDDLLIAVRDWPRYGVHFAALGQTYGLPLALHRGEPLADNPAVTMLLKLLELHAEDFRRNDLFDILRSPYFDLPGLSHEQAERLERISRALVITGGRGEWLAALERATRTLLDADAPEKGHLLDAEAAGSLRPSLEAFFNTVTPPEVATAETYVAWIEGLIGPDSETAPDEEPEESTDPGFRLIPRIRQDAPESIGVPDSIGAPEEIVARDLLAVHRFKGLLRGLLSTQGLLEALHGSVSGVEWPVFMADLQAAVNGATVNRSPGHDGRALVTSVTDARGLPHRHVFIVGLSEGIFPAKVSEDPLYLDSERRALNTRGIPLQTQAERADDDGLFYELVSLARESLTLSRPYVQEGVLWPESHLWRAVRQVFDTSPERIAIGSVVAPENVASRQEAALATAVGLNPPQTPEAAARLHGWLLAAHGDYWGHIRRGREIELGRMSRAQSDHYSGRLSDPTLVVEVAHRLGPAHTWSASQFNEYGICGFRFFAGRLLKLEALEEPEDGMAATHLGTVYHEILEHTYRQLAERSIPISAEHVDEALNILHQTAQTLLRDAPARIGFRASVVWEQEQAVLLRQLEGLIRLDFSSDSPALKITGNHTAERFSYRQEAAFESHFTIDLGGEVGKVRVRGFIDRIDRQGDQAIVIDYKTGSAEIPVKQMERGRNFQMMVYLLAAAASLTAIIAGDAHAPPAVAGGLFWLLGKQNSSGDLRLSDPDGQAALQQAREHLRRNIAQGRQGDFSAQGNQLEEGRCVRYCEFHQLCRIHVTNQRKA